MFTNRFYIFLSRHSVFISCTLVTISIATIYLTITPSRLTNANYGSDGGDFLAAVLTHGIPHPTGYPTYTVLGFLFQYIPLSTPVFKSILESLIPAALGAGLLTGWMCFVLGSDTTSRLGSAIVAGSAWGIAPLLFSQAVIVEVHGLQSLFIVLGLWWMTINLQYRTRFNTKWLLGLSLLVGIGFGNHLTGLLFVPALLITLIYSAREYGSWKLILAQVALMLAGLFIYIYLPLSARTYPPINWGNPQTWSGFTWEVTANPYQGLFFGTQTSAVWERIRSIASIILDQFGALGLIAGVIGAIQYSFSIKWLRWILVWIFVAYFVFAIGYGAEDSVGYLLPAIMVFAIWIGLAIPSLWNIHWKGLPIGMLLIALLVISIWIRIPGTRSRIDPRDQDQPARYAEQFLRDAPLNAIVNSTTDQDTFPLWYYHFGLHERPDLRIVVLPLTQFVWYQETLVHTYTDLEFPAIYPKDMPNDDWAIQILQLNPERPVCNTRVSAEVETGVTYQCTSP